MRCLLHTSLPRSMWLFPTDQHSGGNTGGAVKYYSASLWLCACARIPQHSFENAAGFSRSCVDMVQKAFFSPRVTARHHHYTTAQVDVV